MKRYSNKMYEILIGFGLYNTKYVFEFKHYIYVHVNIRSVSVIISKISMYDWVTTKINKWRKRWRNLVLVYEAFEIIEKYHNIVW